MRFLRGGGLCGAVLVAGLMLAGCTNDNGPAVAYVNGQEIGANDYLSLLEWQPVPPGSRPGIYILNRMIEDRLLVREAQQQKVAPTEQDLKSFLDAALQRPEFQQLRKTSGMSDEQLEHLLIEPVMARERLLSKLAGVKDQDITQFIQEHKAQLTEPEQARVRVLQFADKKKAEDALKLVGKSSFEAIAQTMGLGPNAGNVITLHRQEMGPYPKAVVDSAFSLGKGQTSGILEAAPPPNFTQPTAPPAGKQYYIVSVEDRVPPHAPDPASPFDRERVLSMVIQQKAGSSISPSTLQDMTGKLHTEALRGHQIQVVRPALKELESSVPPASSVPGMGGP
jgi:hypothetical protein